MNILESVKSGLWKEDEKYMTIEQKINNYIKKINVRGDQAKNYDEYIFLPYIEDWDEPELMSDIMSHTIEFRHVNKLIQEADEAECLTSGVRYIRECKKKLLK